MYKKILVPLDGSKRAERILPHVEELAFHCQASVVLLKIVGHNGSNPNQHVPFSKSELKSNEQRMKAADSYLSALQGEFREKGIEAKVVTKQGSIVRWICNVAQSEDVDLIAMASHGHTGLERVFYGSVAAGVLQQVDRPLLLIRARTGS
jgi:nucleotide-binding universal stress UspA family protein